MVTESLDSKRKATWVISDYDKYFDTVLEVIRPETRRVIARRRFDECLPFLVDGQYLASFGTVQGGANVSRVWEVNLLPQAKERVP